MCRYAELSDPQEAKLELIVKLLGNSEYTQIKQLKWLLEDEVNWMDKGANSYYITCRSVIGCLSELFLSGLSTERVNFF